MIFLKQWNIALVFSWLSLALTASSDFVNVKAIEGYNRTITCNTTEGPDVEVYWTQADGSSIFQTGAKLDFVNITRNESGNYTCHSANKTHPGQSLIVVVVEIDVLYEAEITEFTVSPAIASVNDTFEITCHVDGNPSPAWEIRRRKTYMTHDVLYRSLEASGANVNVTATCRDNGAFECTASNVINLFINATQRQSVNVFCAPEPIHVHVLDYPSPEIQTTHLGWDTFFMEEVNCYPPPTFTWSRDDGEPISDADTAVYHEGSRSIGVLNISNVQIVDYGNYSLFVNNSLGSYTAEYILKPSSLQAPEAPSNLTFSDVTNHSVRLNWTSGFDMWKNISFQVLRNMSDGWYEITTLTPTGAYENHGVGVQWSYELTDLESGVYTLTLTERSNSFFPSAHSNIITFNITGPDSPAPRGSPDPPYIFPVWASPDPPHKFSVWAIFACVAAGIVVIAGVTVGIIRARTRVCDQGRAVLNPDSIRSQRPTRDCDQASTP